MMRILSCLLLFLVFAGCATTSQVHVMTEPPRRDGAVLIVETNQIVPSGATVALEPGKYTLTDFNHPDEAPVPVMVPGKKTTLEVVVPLYREKRTSTLTLITEPSGGEVEIRGKGRSVRDRGTVTLSAGEYVFEARKVGYPSKIVHVVVDGKSDEDVLIRFGRGTGRLAVEVVPQDAMVSVDGKSFQSESDGVELQEGSHSVRVEKKGYFPVEKDVRILPAELETLRIDLKPVPTAGAVVLVSDPGATLFFRGKVVGETEASLGKLKFGRYEARAVKQLDAFYRMVGSSFFRIADASGARVKIPLDRKEFQLNGVWMEEKDALEKEQRRYDAQKASQRIVVQWNLTGKSLDRVRSTKRVGAFLHGLLRVGDRLNVKANGRQWMFWKRDGNPGDVFKASVQAFVENRPFVLPWSDDEVHRSIAISGSGMPFAELAGTLFRDRVDFPLLDLTDGQLHGAREILYRSNSDGTLTLVIAGGEGVQVDRGEVSRLGAARIVKVAPGTGAVTVSWSSAPKHLLCIGKESPLFQPIRWRRNLSILEKQRLRLTRAEHVQEVLRLSSGPQYTGWERELLRAAGPLAGQVDLGEDEIGPNDRSGSYTRTWIVRYRDGGVVTQRQVDLQYMVGSNIVDPRGDQFLRRSSAAQ